MLILESLKKGEDVGLLFGNEQSGLDNSVFKHCHYHLYIPSNANYSSLNLAAAIQVTAYEIYQAIHNDDQASRQTSQSDALADGKVLSNFYTHLEKVLWDIKFLNPAHPKRLMQRLQRLFNRSQLETLEVNILRGILTAIEHTSGTKKPASNNAPPSNNACNQYTDETTHRKTKPIYLDYMSTTPTDERVIKKMLSCLSITGTFGNPSSNTHIYGWEAKETVELARQQVADLIKANKRDITWTSGATEAINLALKGAAFAYQRQGKHIVTCKTEHSAVLNTCRYLASQGFDITYLSPQPNGLIDTEEFSRALRPDTILASIMHINNEIGVIQDIASLSQITRSRGILFHVDAAQSGGKVPIDVSAWPVDLLSLSAHKLYGPKGVGALFVRRHPRVNLIPLLHGGRQEGQKRSGTLATHQIIGMGEACHIAQTQLKEHAAHLLALRKKLWQGLQVLDDIHLNGDATQRSPDNLNISFGGVDGESLLFALNGIAVSTGSACISGSTEPSHVLRALGISDTLARSTLRFSIGRYTTEKDIDQTIKHVVEKVRELRKLSPLWT